MRRLRHSVGVDESPHRVLLVPLEGRSAGMSDRKPWDEMTEEEKRQAVADGLEGLRRIGETFTKGMAALSRNFRYGRARQATKTLRETLAEMKAKDVRGEYTGLDVFGHMLDQVDAYITHHQTVTEQMANEEKKE